MSWKDCRGFCNKLSQRAEEVRAGRTYRLPTEAEWEYACRAGVSTTAYSFGSALSIHQANFNGDVMGRLQRPSPVGSYPPNAWGLYDMHGNLWEWVADWFDEAYYRDSPRRDPQGPASGASRVLRGGAWYCDARMCRAAHRARNEPDRRYYGYGFRVVLPWAAPHG